MKIKNSSTVRRSFFYMTMKLCLIILLCPIIMHYHTHAVTLYAKESKTETASKAGAAESKKADNERVEKSDSKETAAGTPENKETVSTEGGYLYDYEEPKIEEESYIWLIFKTLFVMAVMVGGFYFFFKFITQKVGISAIGQNVITILSIVPVGQNKFLQVVDIAGRVYVLGVSDNNINLITEIKERDDIDRIRLLSSKSTPGRPGGFQEYLSTQLGKVLERMKQPGRPPRTFYEEETVPSDEILLKYRQRIKKLNGDDTV